MVDDDMSRHQHTHQWEASAFHRRMSLLLIITITTVLASGYMAYVLPQQGRNLLELVLLVFFAILFAWISIGFWTSLMGFVLLVGKSDCWNIDPGPEKTLAGNVLPPTAVLLPIYNEDPDRVFAGINAVYRSLEMTGRSDSFHFFVLSDTSDPDIWMQEEAAWYESCSRLDAFGRFFYRHRIPNIKRKSGNIADFCRRWGRNYTYMLVLDADSLMSGKTMVRMVQLMEQNPDTGILQTPPMLAGKNSLLARVQQFTNHMYGAVFAAGLHFWQLGDAQYWGHNAIIRVAPFMRHCALRRLSGKPPMGGDILSHDFVEAAMMRRGGWGVWLGYTLCGSFEEPPSTLIDELMRDRRWCQGNMQHLRLLLTKGILPAHRFLFLNGAMSYISALLWFCFLSLSTAEAVSMALFEPNYFPHEGSLFPDWPVWDPSWMLILLASTIVILFLPKVLGLILILANRGRARAFGGYSRVLFGFAAEIFFSALLAPIRMLTHSKFVAVTLLGGKIGWNAPNRNEQGTGWKQALRFHGIGSILGLVWGLGLFWINRGFFWWMVPVIVPLVLAIPLSIFISSTKTGERLRRWRLFLTPPESAPPFELAQLRSQLQAGPRPPSRGEHENGTAGFVMTVTDPLRLCLRMLAQRGARPVSGSITHKRKRLIEKALRQGPGSLSPQEKKQLLNDAASLHILHEKVWELPGGDQARRWGL